MESRGEIDKPLSPEDTPWESYEKLCRLESRLKDLIKQAEKRLDAKSI